MHVHLLDFVQDRFGYRCMQKWSTAVQECRELLSTCIVEEDVETRPALCLDGAEVSKRAERS